MNFGDRCRLASPGVIVEQESVDAECFADGFVRRVRDIAHRKEPHALEPSLDAMTDAPKIRERRMLPEYPAKRFFIETADAVGGVLRRDVECDFRKIQIRPDATRRWQPETLLNFAEQESRHFVRRLVVELRVARDVDEGFIDGVDENVLFAEVVEVNAVDFGGVVEIQLHPWCRHDVAEA